MIELLCCTGLVKCILIDFHIVHFILLTPNLCSTSHEQGSLSCSLDLMLLKVHMPCLDAPRTPVRTKEVPSEEDPDEEDPDEEDPDEDDEDEDQEKSGGKGDKSKKKVVPIEQEWSNDATGLVLASSASSKEETEDTPKSKPKKVVINDKAYLPRVFMDTKVVDYLKAKDAGDLKGTAARKAFDKIKSEEAELRTQRLAYKPGSYIPPVTGLSRLHVDRRYRRAFEHNIRSQHAGTIIDSMRKGSCAIVGNSGLLLKTTYGAMIDLHDVVIRMNLAPTTGYERHVGEKTSVRVLNNALGKVLTDKFHKWDAKMRDQVIGKDVQMWMRADEDVTDKMRAALRAKEDLRPVVLMDHDFVYSSIAFFRQWYIAYLDKLIKENRKDSRLDEWRAKLAQARSSDPVLATVEGGYKLFGKPSTGISMLYGLKDMCASVTLYGCGTHDAGGHPGPYKYYQPNKETTMAGNMQAGTVGSHSHSFEFEQELMLAIDQAGLAKMCSYKHGDRIHNAKCIHPKLKAKVARSESRSRGL